MSERAEFYRDGSGEWRWRVLAGNNRVVADSGEGYKHLTDCKDEFTKLFGDMPFDFVDGEA